MSHPIIFNGSLGLGLMLVGLGLNATLRPNNHLKSLEFPIPTEPLAKKFSLALMRIWGIRNITVGVLISIIWTTGDENLMAKALSAALAMPITDGFVSRIIIGGGETQHWVFPPLLVVMIAGLFGYF
ncbi:integral membrane protein [Fusarium bulbicola]|nr:integral membrane protein [Fusarium bulbicola]